MAFRPIASRRSFDAYKQEVRRRRLEDPPVSAKGKPVTRHRSFGELFREFLKLLRGFKKEIAFALATVSVSTLLGLIPPAATKVTIDYVLSDKPIPEEWVANYHLPSDKRQFLILIGVGLIVVSVLDTLIHLWGRWHATAVTKRVQVHVRRLAFDHAVRLPLHKVYQLKSGGVASILREDAGGVAELIFSMLYNPWRAVLQLVGSLIILAFVDWQLLAGAILFLPIVYLTHRTWIGRIRPLYRDARIQRQEVDSHATEAFGGMRVVRAFGRQRSEASRFIRGNHLMARQELYVWWWVRIVETIWEVLVPIASAALLLYGGMAVLSGSLTLGDLMMFLFYLAMLLGPLAVLANSATAFQSGLSGLDRILDLLEEQREMPAAPGARSIRPDEVRGRIRLDAVNFRYPGSEELVLRDIQLEVPAGTTVALVGPSGAGKTTLCNLVARFYDPTSGTVELDGMDLRDIKVESYRRLLGIVEQDVFLFDGTLAENIGYAVRDADIDAIRQAARIANADGFILALEKGYDTVIGERGVRLSGGQRQRVAIARAVLANPPILILDEATSSLDTESERLIQQSMRELMRGRTCFVIAHRLSTIVHADKILVMEAGRIIETGTHAELMAASGRYRQMVRMQMGHVD
ncbi:MAG: ABC transporter ATP-binding protein [Planctomycetota bacterium]